MSFDVDTKSLREFADFLEDYGKDADAAHDFVYDETEVGISNGGALELLVGAHADIRTMMQDRMSLMRKVGSGCSLAMGDVAYMYDHADEMGVENLAEADAEYESVTVQDRETSPEDDPYVGFSYQSAQDLLKITEDSKDIEPMGSEVEQWTRGIFDGTSVTAIFRGAVKEILGLDPFDEVRQVFMGDWAAWARCSIAWGACHRAVSTMASNFSPALAKLPQVWQGNAADGATSYFIKLADATTTEAEAFSALEEGYLVYMEYIWVAYTVCNDILNAMGDLAIDLILLAGTGTIAMFKALWDLWGALGQIITAVMDTCRLFGAVGGLFDLSEVPACALAELTGQGHDNVYDHPHPEV